MLHRCNKLISLALCALLLLEQTGFAQTVSLNLSHYLTQSPTPIASNTFRPLHLRYLSYDNLNQDFKLLLDKGDFLKESLRHQVTTSPEKQEKALESETQNLLRYFFIGLALPNDKFWVNLRPDAPDNIIDADLARTDIGRIFLEADVQLKKDTAQFTSPQTPEGKAYWDKLYQKAGELFGTENITIPTLTRPWIVPNEIIIREAPDNAYIYKATLKVMLEEDYLTEHTPAVRAPHRGGAESGHGFSDPRLKELNEYSTQLIKELIIPKLAYQVNASKRYAPLRQVYYSLILAQWFKQKLRDGSFSELLPSKNRPYSAGTVPKIDSGDLTNLVSKESYDKQDYFKQYQKSFAEGEYNLQEPVYTPMGQSIRRYMSGGIGLGNALNTVSSPFGDDVRLTKVKVNNGGFPVFINNLVDPLDKVVNVKFDMVSSAVKNNINEQELKPNAKKPSEAPHGYTEKEGLFLPRRELYTGGGIITPKSKSDGIFSDKIRELESSLKAVNGIKTISDLRVMDKKALGGYLQNIIILKELQKEGNGVLINKDPLFLILNWPEASEPIHKNAYILLNYLHPNFDYSQQELEILLDSIYRMKTEQLEFSRNIIYIIPKCLADLSEENYEKYLYVVSRLSRYHQRILNVPEKNTFGIELEVALKINEKEIDVLATGMLFKHLKKFLLAEGLKEKGWVVKQDALGATEITTGDGGLPNTAEGFKVFKDGLSLISNEIIRFRSLHYPAFALRQGLHIHIGHPDSKNENIMKAVGVIGKAMEYYWSSLSVTGNILTFADDALLGQPGDSKNHTPFYDSARGTIAFNTFSPPKLDLILENEDRYFGWFQTAIGTAMNIVHSATTKTDEFNIWNIGLPVFQRNIYTPGNSFLLRKHLKHLFGENHQGIISMLQLLFDMGRLPQLLVSEESSKDNDRIEKFYKEHNLGFLYTLHTKGNSKGWLPNIKENMLAMLNDEKYKNELIAYCKTLIKYFSVESEDFSWVMQLVKMMRDNEWIKDYGEIISAYKGLNLANIFYSSDGKYIAFGPKLRNGSIMIWDVNSWSKLRILKAEQWIDDIIYFFDGKYIISRLTDGRVIEWNVASGEKSEKGGNFDSERFKLLYKNKAVEIGSKLDLRYHWELNDSLKNEHMWVGEAGTKVEVLDKREIDGEIWFKVRVLKIEDRNFTYYGLNSVEEGREAWLLGFGRFTNSIWLSNNKEDEDINISHLGGPRDTSPFGSLISSRPEDSIFLLPFPVGLRHRYSGNSASSSIDVKKNSVTDDMKPIANSFQQDLGGIDLTSLPITAQSVLARPVGANIPIANPALNLNINLDNELKQIQDMLKAGIMPSSERIREYVLAASSLKQEDCGREVDKILGCIADIFRLEEKEAKPAPQALKDILILLESDKPAQELQLASLKD